MDLITEEVKLVCDSLSYRGLCIFICVENIADGERKIEAVKRVFKV